jgi:hypothetical protein
MFVDTDAIDEAQYLLLMLLLNLSGAGYGLPLHSLLVELERILSTDEANDTIDKAHEASLIWIQTEDGHFIPPIVL